MKRFIPSLLMLICFLSMNLSAREADDNAKVDSIEKHNHGLGLAYGKTTGKWMAYRHYLDKFSVQLAFMPRVIDVETDFEINASLTFMYKLSDSKYIDLFVYQSNQYRYLTEPEFPPNQLCSTYYCPYPLPWSTSKNHYYDTGIGFGFELLLWKRLSINLMLGYAARKNFSEFGISPETALFYNF